MGAIVPALLLSIAFYFSMASSVDGFNSEHLEPEGSFFGSIYVEEIEETLEYDRALRMAFQTAYGDDVILRMITDSARASREQAVYVKKTESGSHILVSEIVTYPVDFYIRRDELAASDDDSDKDLAAELPKSLDNYPRFRCERPLPSFTADILRSLWEAALLQTRYPPPVLATGEMFVLADGVTFHFSDRFATHAGQTHSPDEDGKMGRLVAIGLSLEDYCQAGSEELLSDIEKNTKSLLRSLRHSRLR